MPVLAGRLVAFLVIAVLILQKARLLQYLVCFDGRTHSDVRSSLEKMKVNTNASK